MKSAKHLPDHQLEYSSTIFSQNASPPLDQLTGCIYPNQPFNSEDKSNDA
ncbi:hypothetical protein [Coleofasciculus sp. E1-EBD-02]